jgi:hypothetical protein
LHESHGEHPKVQVISSMVDIEFSCSAATSAAFSCA